MTNSTAALTLIALETRDGDYDLYTIAGPAFTEFDDLRFVRTVTSRPEGARRINENEPANAEYVATYAIECDPMAYDANVSENIDLRSLTTATLSAWQDEANMAGDEALSLAIDVILFGR